MSVFSAKYIAEENIQVPISVKTLNIDSSSMRLFKNDTLVETLCVDFVQNFGKWEIEGPLG